MQRKFTVTILLMVLILFVDNGNLLFGNLIYKLPIEFGTWFMAIKVMEEDVYDEQLI